MIAIFFKTKFGTSDYIFRASLSGLMNQIWNTREQNIWNRKDPWESGMYSPCNGSCKETTGHVWLRFCQTERAWDQKPGDLHFNPCPALNWLWHQTSHLTLPCFCFLGYKTVIMSTGTVLVLLWGHQWAIEKLCYGITYVKGIISVVLNNHGQTEICHCLALVFTTCLG